MMIQKSDFWATLLWDNYLPFIESGAPFYLAADSILIHEWIRKYDSTISIEEALDDFHQSCMSLLDRMSTKAIVRGNAFVRVPGKPYSRVICLAVQQVLVVEKMLAHEQYSERSYFPRYRDLLGISGGSIHVNPIVGFQKIWSTLGNEIVSVVGSSSSTITFCAGTGMDVNRNLPLSQALLTRHDLGILYQESASALRRTETDEKAMIQILCKVAGNLNRRVRNLIGNVLKLVEI